jgi:carboxyl-terminal processing protease
VSEVPDSLIKAFQTKGGRPVFDGRGISPDIEVQQDEMSNVLAGLLRNHVIFHYATRYMHQRDSIASPEEFDIGSDWNDFVKFALDRDFEYDSQTEAVFAELKEIAEMERYFDRAADVFAALEERLVPDKQKDMSSFRSQIEYTLEEEIVTRFHYQKGAIRYALKNDPVVERALKVFGEEYSKILSGSN